MSNTTVAQDRMIGVLHLDFDRAPRNLLHAATARGDATAVNELYNLGFYRRVASVLTDDLKVALKLTQMSWEDAKGVDRVEDAGCRRTVVGDILVLGDDAYVITPSGAQQLPLLLKSEHKQQ